MASERDPYDLLRELPAVFTYRMGIEAGLKKSVIYRLRNEGAIEQIGRGRYQVMDADLPEDFDLLEIAVSVPRATICLTSALSYYALTDAIPAVIDVALPKGRHRPRTDIPAAWHMFDAATFEIGREERCLDGMTSIGIYGPERSIIDAVRLRHLEGPELGHEALRRWLRRPKSTPADLIAMAEKFPKAYREIRRALEILL